MLASVFRSLGISRGVAAAERALGLVSAGLVSDLPRTVDAGSDAVAAAAEEAFDPPTAADRAALPVIFAARSRYASTAFFERRDGCMFPRRYSPFDPVFSNGISTPSLSNRLKM